jgi:hypothetical protein
MARTEDGNKAKYGKTFIGCTGLATFNPAYGNFQLIPIGKGWMTPKNNWKKYGNGKQLVFLLIGISKC